VSEFILDASFNLCWCFEDEATAQTDSILTSLQNQEAIAWTPAIWRYEMLNGLGKGVARGRLTRDKALLFWQEIQALPIRLADIAVNESLLDLALKYNLAVYDAISAWRRIAASPLRPWTENCSRWRKASACESSSHKRRMKESGIESRPPASSQALFRRSERDCIKHGGAYTTGNDIACCFRKSGRHSRNKPSSRLLRTAQRTCKRRWAPAADQLSVD
jgi:predicted nucleic acid-binding protein